MKPITADPATYAKTRLVVPRPRFPKDLVVGKELGKGSNNKVFEATLEGTSCILRAPRRGSDTQQRGSAVWEFRHLLKAAQLGVGPQVYDAWCAKHAHNEWPSGLYVITERLEHDLDTVLNDDPPLRKKAIARKDAIASATVECLRKLADELIFVYDLKPSNVMISFHDKDDGVDVRIIDFGRDFCEWSGCEHQPDSHTPIVTLLRKLILARDPAHTDVDVLVSHVLFASMLVELTATTTKRLRDDRRDTRLSAPQRREANVFASVTERFLASMQGRNVALLREVLRSDEVKTVLRHYHGRRDAGTRRTMRYARGLEGAVAA